MRVTLVKDAVVWISAKVEDLVRVVFQDEISGDDDSNMSLLSSLSSGVRTVLLGALDCSMLQMCRTEG